VSISIDFFHLAYY